MKVAIFTNHNLDASKRLGKGYTQADYKCIDWTNRSDRKWLETHMHWAMNNNMTVSLVPQTV